MKRWIHAASAFKRRYTVGTWYGVDRLRNPEGLDFTLLDDLFSVVDNLSKKFDINLTVTEQYKDNKFGLVVEIGENFVFETDNGFVLKTRYPNSDGHVVFDIVSPAELDSEYGPVLMKGYLYSYIPVWICNIFESDLGLPTVDFEDANGSLELDISDLETRFSDSISKWIETAASEGVEYVDRKYQQGINSLAEQARKKKVREDAKKDRNLSKPVDSRNISQVIREYNKSGGGRFRKNGNILKETTEEFDVIYYSISDILKECQDRDITIGEALDDPSEILHSADSLDLAGPSNRGEGPTKSDLQEKYGF